MFRAAFVTEYDAHLSPEGDWKLPSELETFTIVFFVLFSMSGR